MSKVTNDGLTRSGTRFL